MSNEEIKRDNIMLAILARVTVDITFSECCRPFSHTAAFMLVVSSLENYFKSKLFEVEPNIVFVNNSNNSINLRETRDLINKHFNYQIDESLFKKIIKERNKLFHFAEGEIDPEITFKVLFDIIIPFIETFFIDDLEVYIDFLGEYDDAIFEGYLIEQLDLYKIKYSELLKNKLINEN